MKSSYITSAQKAEQLPDFPFPEVAFIGRSNVGKSSLLNAILDRKDLARTSKLPGRTQMANFFSVEKGDTQVILVDLPGYGYSAIGHESRKDWARLMDGYLKRQSIRSFLFLVDVRRATPMNDEDVEIVASLVRCGAPEGVTVVLTKSDKVSASELAKAKKGVEAQLAQAKIKPHRTLAISTLKKKGLDELKRDVLAPLAEA